MGTYNNLILNNSGEGVEYALTLETRNTRLTFSTEDSYVAFNPNHAKDEVTAARGPGNKKGARITIGDCDLFIPASQEFVQRALTTAKNNSRPEQVERMLANRRKALSDPGPPPY